MTRNIVITATNAETFQKKLNEVNEKEPLIFATQTHVVPDKFGYFYCAVFFLK